MPCMCPIVVLVALFACPVAVAESSCDGHNSVPEMSLLQTALNMVETSATIAAPCDNGSERRLKVRTGSVRATKVMTPPVASMFCAEGRWLPSVYILGAQKGGTTSLASYLMTAGIKPALQPSPLVDTAFSRQKEFHFWDTRNVSVDTAASLRTEWMEFLPTCIKPEPARVIADFTPNSMRMTPLPEGTLPTSFHYSSSWTDSNDGSNATLPSVLQNVYGPALGAELIFVVMLREPVARMQSAFYHAQHVDFTSVCADCRARSFEEALARATREMNRSHPVLQDWVWTSMYNAHLTEWMGTFMPQQFYVIPLQESLTKHGFENVCSHLESRLAFDMRCGDAAPHLNSHSHAALEDDASGMLLDSARELFAPHVARLVTVLTKARSEGTWLSGLQEDESVSEARVAEWLEQSW